MQNVFDYIDSLKPQMVETLSELIAIPSVRGEATADAPFGENPKKCLEKALIICESLGFKTYNCDNYVGTASFTEGEPSLGILAHLDVVPAGEGWVHEPFKAAVEDGKLFGRGAMDDKGPCVAVMYAMKALHDLKIPLKNGFELIMGTDEECGSGDLAYYKTHAKMPKWLFTPDADYPIINIEKGRVHAHFSAFCDNSSIVELHGGQAVNAVPATAYAIVRDISEEDISTAIEKAGCTVEFCHENTAEGIKITALGESAHASTPQYGDNALTALIQLISLLPDCGEAQSKLRGLAAAFPHKETDGARAGVAASDEISGALTLALDILNLENGELAGDIDIRFPVCESVAGVTEKLGKALENAGFSSEISGVEPHCVPSDSAFVKTLLEAYEAVTGKKGECLAIGGGTYVHGTPGGVAFGCEVAGEDNRIHGADEFIRVDALCENAKIFAEAIVRVCNNDELK